MKTDLSMHSYRFAAALALLTAIFQPLSSEAANLTWSTTNGSWTNNASWSPSQQPGSGDGVFFYSSGNDYTSTLGANYTIFRLTVNNIGNRTIAPGGNNILTLSAFDGDGSPSAIQINAGAGAVLIQSALKLDPNDGNDNFISVENAAGLTLSQFAAGTDGFTKEGNGTLFLNLSGSNTIARYTAIERGTVELAAGNLLQDWNMGIADSAGSNGTLNIQSGSMEVDGNFYVGYEGSGTVNVNGGNLTLANQVDIGTGNGTAIVNLNSGSLRQTAGWASMTIGGGSGNGELNISGGDFAVAGFFRIEQNGTLSVSGGNATIGNPTDVNGGFQASGGNAVINLTGGTIASGRVVLSNGAALNLGNGTTAGSAQILSIYTSQNASGTLNLNHNSEATLDSNISNGITINQIGSGTTTLTGNIDVTKNATISSGTLAFGGNSSSISIPSITNNSALVFASSSAGVFAGKISGTGSVAQNGSGMTVLGGNNTYTGQTLVQNGALSISSPQALYNGTASDWVPAKIKVESGATLAFGIGSNSSFSTNSVESLLTALASNATSTGGFQAGSFFGFNTQDAYGSALTPGNTVLEFGIADSSQGALGVSKIGNGILTLNASNTYTGDTRVTGGSLSLGNGGSLASGNLSVTGSGSIFALDYANAGVTFANISVADGGQIQSSSGSVNFTNSAIFSSGTIAAPVGGAGSFLKTGNGTAVISDTLTHTGGTTIEDGTLQIGEGSTSGTISGNVAILQNGTLGFNRSDSITASNAFSGNGAISKIGNNTLTLTGNSADFEGATTISAGTLQIGNGSSTGSLGGNITASTGSTLAYNSSSEVALDGLSGNGTLIQAGNGTLVVSSNVTGFTGSTRIQSGTLQLGNGGTTGGLSGNITNNATLAINRSDDFTFSTNSTGTGKLLKLGTNTVTVNRTQSNTGGTVIDSGTLALASNNILATTGNLVVNELGTFNLGTNNQTLSTVTLNGGNITGTGKITSNSSFAIQGGSVSALLAGSAGLVKSGTSSFAITGNNLYSGKTVVADGTISFNTTNATRTAAQALGTNADFDLGAELSTSGTLNYTGAAATFAKNIKALGAGNNTIQNSGSGLLTLTGTLTKNGTILVLAGGAGGIQVNGVIAGSAENSDLVLNGGNITLNATNTYNGPTYLNNGATLTLSVANALPGDLIIDASSSVAFGANQTIEALSGVAGSTIDIGSYTLTMGSNGTDSLYEGGIEGSGKVAKTGTNAITLSGTNTYNGTTTINGGVLVFGVPSSLYNGDNSTWTGSKIVVNSGGAIALAVGANGSFTGNQVTEIFDSLSSNSTPGGILAGGSFGLDVTGEMEMQQVASNRQGGGAIGFVKLGDGTLTITGNNTYTGPTAIRGGTLALASSDLLVATGNLTVQGGTLALGSNNQTFNRVTLAEGSITGNGGVLTASNYGIQSGTAIANLAGNATLQKTTSGSAILSGTNTYTGSTTISAGALTFLTSTSLYGGDTTSWNSGNISAASGSTIAFGLGLSGGFSPDNITNLITNLTQNQTTSGGIAAGAKIGLDTSGDNATISTEFKNRTGTGSGTLSLVKLGEGTLTLTGNNSYTGGTFIETGTLTGNSLSLKGNITTNGTLLLGTYGTYQTEVSGNGNLLVGNGENIIFTGNATMTGGTTIQSGILTIGGVIDPTSPYSPSSYRAGSLTGNISNEGGLVFDISSLAGTRTYNGTISGNGSLSTTFTPYHYPLGANGTLRLTGNNTFTGGTSVSIGTLDISGGTLASTGSVTVSDSGTLAIGSSNQTIGLFLLNSQSAQATGAGTLTTTAENYDLRAGTVYLSLNGTAGLTKNSIGSGSNSYDNGLVYLGGNNTSTGNITISSGILSFDNVRSLYSGNNASWTKEKISVSANATLSLATGAGGATDGFNNAQITEIFSNLTQNGTGGLSANSKIGLNTTGNFTLTTTITDRPDGGVIGLDKIGGATLTLDANNTFTGELSVFEGTIALGRSNALRTSSDLVVDSKSSAAYGFNVGNYSQQFVDITLKEGLLAGESGAFIATGNYTLIKGNATANLSGNASLIKTNTSGSSYNVYEPEIVFLSGNNSYTGRTTIDGSEWYGTQSPSPSSNPGAPTKDNAKLQFQTVGSLYGGNATLWTPENISVDSYGIFALRTGSAGFNATQVSTIIQNLITANRSTGGFLDKSVLGIDTNGENLVINDDIGDTTGLTSGGGAVGLVKYGSGTLTLNGNSTRSFSTSVTGGNLVLGANATLSSASANLLVDNALLNMGATNQTVRKVTVTSGYILGSGTLTSSADGFVFGTANITANLAGAVGATIDQGTTILSGNNTYTGNTTMGYSATLSLANVNALSGSTLVILSNYSGPLQLSVNGTNTYNFGGLSGTANIATASNSLTIGANSQNSTYSGNLSGTGSITKTGNGTLTLSGNNTYTGGTTISSGTLSISNNGSITHASVDTNIGNGTLNLSSGSISNARGNIGVNAGSTGVATVSGGNWTNSGNFTVGDSGNGTLNLSGGLISNTGNYSYIGLNTGSKGVANVSGGNWTNGEELRVGDSGNGTLNITGGTVSNTAGFLAYGNGSTGVVNVSGGTWSNSDRLRLGRYGNGTLNLTGGNVSIAGGAGNLTVTVHSSSTGILNIGNGTTVGNLQAARVTAGSGTAIVNFNHSGNHSFAPIMEGNLTVNKLGSGTTILSGNNTYTGGTFITAGTLQGSTQNLQGAITTNGSVVFNQTTNGTYSGVLSGSGEFAKTGAGTLTVTGNSSSFNGTADINSGTVSLTGSIANAVTTINSGGTLTGNGSLGALTINSGGSINPGNSPGILTVGNSVWNGGGIYNWELANANGDAGTGWDLIDSSGNLTITANSSNRFIINASTNNASGFNPNVKNASWKIAEFDGGISGFSANAFSINATGFANLPSIYAFGITKNGTALNFNYATVATWIGGTGNWTNTADWDTGFAPINGVAVDYAGTNGTSTNDSTVVNIGGLTFTNNASGSFTLAGGALSIGTGGITNDSAFTNTIGMDLVLGANQTFAANTANLVVSGNISGNSSLTKAGNQTLTFSGNNTYTSTTTISAGTLQIASANALGSGGNITFGGGTLQFGSGITTDVSSRLKNSVTAIQIDTDNNNITFASDVDATNTGGLKKLGSGNLSLTGNNTYTGDTTVKNGTLALPVGGSISSAGNMTIGSASGDNGALTISGGNVSNAVGSIGNDAGSVGAVTVSSGNWTNSGQLYVGNGGTGNLTISGGAVSNGWTEVAAGGGSVGNILVNGGTWNSGSLFLGLSGNGTLNLAGGSINSGGGVLGLYAPGVGRANVTSGTWAMSDDLNIGLWGTGSLSISGSGNVTNSNSLLGGAVGASGSATVSGGTWANSGVLNIGRTGTGNLTISGGSVSNTVGYLGNDASGNGVASVSGGTWANSGDLVIGNSGTGSLMISGGNVTNTTGYVALGFGSNGAVSVSGGTWANSGALTIGYDGTGSLTINGTGTVTNAIGNIGYGGGGNGTVNISGGTWANSSYLFIGALNGSRGSLTINSGNVTNTDGYVGNGASSNGTASVSGGTWANSGELTIGRDGTGSLAISGGNVTNTSGNIGSNAGSNGTVNVSGGTWTNSSNLAVGGAGTGSLTINGTGTVIVGDTLSRGSNGTINLESGGTLQIGTGGATGTLATDLTNNGTLIFNLTGSSEDTHAISGTGTLTKNGTGTLILSGSNTYTGSTTVNAGTLEVNSTLANTATTVNSGGTLAGIGSLGNVTINSGGAIAPGNSPGTITVGNLTLNGGAIYNWQLGNATGTAGQDWDLISSLGTLGLNATSSNITLSLSTLGNATLTGVKKATWAIGNSTQNITGFNKNAFSIDYNSMNGSDGRYFMSLSNGNKTLLLNYKTAATWNTGNGNWTTLGQWEDNSRPEDGDAVEFTGAGGISINNFLSGNLSYISGLSFLEGAGAYTVAGNTLEIGQDGIINASNQTQTIAMDLTSDGLLTVNAASGNLVLSGVFSGNWQHNLDKTGNQTLTLTGNNTYEGGTIISAGTLALGGTAGAVTGDISVNSGATFAVNRTNDFSLGNIISGAGSFAHIGSNKTSITAVNTYTGGTTISSGTLWTKNSQALGTGNVLVNGGKLLTTSSQEPIMGNQTLSIGGNLDWTSGKIAFYDTGSSPLSGDLTINVAGNFTASVGNKTFDFSEVEALGYGNYTLVNATVVSAGSAIFVAAHGPYTTLFGNFTTTNNTVVYTVTGAESTGSDIQNNGGPNTPVVAVFDVTQATQTIGANNTVNALDFSNSASLTIDATGQLTVTSGTLGVQTGSSVVSGGTLNTPGNFDKTGAGELDLDNTTNVNGIANVVAGLLSVNGQLNANSVMVDPTATLGGAGVIVAQNVVVNGNLSPGNSPGTLNVVGNLVLGAGSSTVIEIASPTNFDRIVVSGTATLGGTLNAVAYGGGTITPGARYDFLQAGSIAGEFDSLIAPDGLRIRFLNSGTVGTLLFGPESFVPYALNQNQINVAKALDIFVLATEGDAIVVGTALDSLTTEQFPAAFDQIMPGFYESLANIAIEQAFAQTQMLNQRISSVRLGAAGFQAIGGISQPLVNDKNGKSAAEAKDASPIVESATATNWNSWALGTGIFSRTTNLGSVDNYNNNAGGFLVGADYRWSENFVTGLYAGYDYSYAEYNGGGSTKGNSFSFGTYASYAKDGYYADAVIGGGYTGFQTQRSIEFSTIDRTASADPNSGQFTAGLNLGKDFEVGKFTLGPIVGAQYTYAGIGSFTESGAESLDLSLGQQNANSLRTTLGGRIAYTWNMNQKIALIPEVRMFWQHEFLNNPRNISAGLDGGNGAAFDFETSDPYRDSVFAGAGVTAQFGKNLSGSVFYNINFGSQTYQSNMVSAGLNFSF